MFAKHYFILLNWSTCILTDVKQCVMLSSCSTFVLMMVLPRNTSYLGLLCLYCNIYSPVLYLVTLINLQALFCYVVPLNVYQEWVCQHFTLCQLLLVNQWICQALLYCYSPAVPVFHIRDGFAKHCFIFMCIRKTAKIDLASSCLSICLCMEQLGSHSTDFLEI